jgi:hypothetical protein
MTIDWNDYPVPLCACGFDDVSVPHKCSEERKNKMNNEIEINGEIYIKKSDSNESINNTTNEKAALTFSNMGYEILTMVEGTKNGPDLHIKKDDLVLRVEIKKARPSKRSMAVHPIEPSRKNDDLVAVVFPSGYVFIEPMKDYLFNCSDCGTRSFLEFIERNG